MNIETWELVELPSKLPVECVVSDREKEVIIFAESLKPDMDYRITLTLREYNNTGNV